MAAVDVETTAFLIGEEGFHMSAFVGKRRRQLRVRDVGQQEDRVFTGLIPNEQDVQRSEALGGNGGRADPLGLARLQGDVSNGKLTAFRRDQDVRGRATDVLPACLHDISLQIRAIELTIAQEDHLCIGWHDGLQLFEQFAVEVLRQMPFLGLDDHPCQR